MKIVYFATPSIALSTLEFLHNQEDVEICAVVTQPDRPSGRGHKIIFSPIKEFALKNNIEILQPEKIRDDKECIERLKQIAPDFFVTFAFGQILSQEVLDIPKNSTINLHGSILPKYRGANPIFRAILDGETKTGATTMKTDIGLDSGDICIVEEIEITPDMNAIELVKEFEKISPSLMYKTLKGLLDNTITPIQQEHAKATIAKKFKKEDGIINWDETAQQIHNQIRAMLIFPVAQTTFNNKSLKILKAKNIENNKEYSTYGEVIAINKDGIEVSTQKGSLLIQSVKPEGKGQLDAYAWSNGVNLKIGDIFK
ncbi:methionyl-tRNA formyltransferase [bacterium]|nr:methionyl-tRNA formyltransferase [bacterium]